MMQAPSRLAITLKMCLEFWLGPSYRRSFQRRLTETVEGLSLFKMSTRAAVAPEATAMTSATAAAAAAPPHRLFLVHANFDSSPDRKKQIKPEAECVEKRYLYVGRLIWACNPFAAGEHVKQPAEAIIPAKSPA